MKHDGHARQRPIIQSLWIGPSLSVLEQMCLSSFLEHGCEVHLYVYDQVAGVPAGVALKDAHAIVPAAKIFKYREYNSYAGFANLFRYQLLLQKGQYWTDTDIVCMKPFAHPGEHLFASQRMQVAAQPAPALGNRLRGMVGMAQKPGPVPYEPNNCLIKAPAGSPVMAYCYDTAATKNPQELQWGETGPILLKAAVEKFGLWECVAKPEAFCPINWWDYRRAVEELPAGKWPAATEAVHLWNEKWRRDGIDKEGTFPAECFYEKMKKKHWRGPY